MVEQEQWEAWLLDPVTQRLREWAKWQAEAIRDQWESGGLQGETEYLAKINDNLAQGMCQVFRKIEEMDYQRMIGDEEDVSPERVEDRPAGEPERGY